MRSTVGLLTCRRPSRRSSMIAVPPTQSTPRSLPSRSLNSDEDAVASAPRTCAVSCSGGRSPARAGSSLDRPVDRRPQIELGAAQGQRARHLRELEVVTDRARRAGRPRVSSTGGARGAGGEDQPLAVPQVRLAVDGAATPAGVHDRGAVVQSGRRRPARRSRRRRWRRRSPTRRAADRRRRSPPRPPPRASRRRSPR